MNTIIILTATAVVVLFSGIYGRRQLLMPLALVGLLGAFVANWVGDMGTFDQFANMIKFDRFAVMFSGVAILSTILVTLLSAYFLRNDQYHTADKYGLMLFSLCGALILFSYNNLTLLFLGIEILSIPIYVLAGSDKNNLRSNEAAIKYFLMGAFATGFLLFGIALVYGVCGSLELTQIAQVVSKGALPGIFYVGILLLMVGLLFKISVAPFHFWSPDVYQGTPSIFTAYMATVVKTAGFASFFKLFLCFASVSESWAYILALLSALTMTVGNVTAIAQTNFKRMLAYSSISHAGYLLMAIISMQFESIQALLLYTTAYSLATIGAFAALLLMQEQRNGDTQITTFKGLYTTNPALAVALGIFMMSLAGLPLTAGFLGKYFLFSLTVGKYTWLTVVAIINSAISIYYYFRIIVAMFFQPSESTAPTPLYVPQAYQVTLLIALIGILLLGVFPEPILSVFTR